jgi:hypothetical protein
LDSESWSRVLGKILNFESESTTYTLVPVQNEIHWPKDNFELQLDLKNDVQLDLTKDLPQYLPLWLVSIPGTFVSANNAQRITEFLDNGFRMFYLQNDMKDSNIVESVLKRIDIFLETHANEFVLLYFESQFVKDVCAKLSIERAKEFKKKYRNL